MCVNTYELREGLYNACKAECSTFKMTVSLNIRTSKQANLTPTTHSTTHSIHCRHKISPLHQVASTVIRMFNATRVLDFWCVCVCICVCVCCVCIRSGCFTNTPQPTTPPLPQLLHIHLKVHLNLHFHLLY